MAINYTPKAHVTNSASLPTTGNTVGDVRITLNDGKQYYWNGSTWVILETFKQRNIPGNVNGPFTLADHIADNDPHDQYLLRSDFNDLVLSGDLGQILNQHIEDPNAHGSNYLKPDVIIHELINTSDKIPDVGLLYRVNTSMQYISSVVSANNSAAMASITSATNFISAVSSSAHNDSVALNSSIRDLFNLHSQEISALNSVINNMSAAEIGNLAEVASSGRDNAIIANSRIGSLITTVNSNTSAIGTINTKIDAIPGSISNIASTLDSALSSNINTRLTQLSSVDNQLNSSFIHVSTNVNNASSKLNSMITSVSGALSNSISAVNNNYVEHIDATDWVIADNDPGISSGDPGYISVTAVTDLEERTDAVGTYVYVDEASAWYINQYNNPHPQYVLVSRVVSSVDLGSYDTNLIPTVSVVSEVNQKIIDHTNATTNIHPQYSLTDHDHNDVYALINHTHDQYVTIDQFSTVSSVPIGTIFAYPSIDGPAGAMLLNGQVLSNCKNIYPDFWYWVVNTSSIRKVDLATYNSEITNTGVCGAFVVDDTEGSESIKLPTLTDAVIQGADSTTNGNSFAAGLPGFDGTIAITMHTHGTANINDTSDTNRPIATKTSNTSAVNASITYPTGSIYGKSTTVQPTAVKYGWFIQVFNTYVAEANMNVTDIWTDHIHDHSAHAPISKNLLETSFEPEHNTIYVKTASSGDSYSFTAPSSGESISFRLYILQGSTIYEPTWPSNIVWDEDNTVPTFTKANALYMFVFEWNPVLNKWLGSMMWDPVTV